MILKSHDKLTNGLGKLYINSQVKRKCVFITFSEKFMAFGCMKYSTNKMLQKKGDERISICGSSD